MAKRKPPPPVEGPRVAVGVYTNHNRETSIVVKQSDRGVWYLTMQAGYIEVKHVGDERFRKDFPLSLREYPVRRALKLYETSGLRRDEDAQRVMQRLLERM